MRYISRINPEENWRDETNKLISKICKKLNSYNYPKENIYKALETKAKCDLKRKLEKKVSKVVQAGVSRSKAMKLNYLDIIAEDDKLIEIYVGIVKELAIKNKVV